MTPENTIHAAGGLLEKQTPDGVRIAVVHRNRYRSRDDTPGDWVLPKGKQDAGESPRQTAEREVLEETGCQGRTLGSSFTCEYRVRGVPKIVWFFRMICVAEGPIQDTSEVDRVAWLTPREALVCLTYDRERGVLLQAYPDLQAPGSENATNQT